MSNAKFKRSQAELAAKRAAMMQPIETTTREVSYSRSGVGVTPSKKLITKKVGWTDKLTGEKRFGKIECRGATVTVATRKFHTCQVVTSYDVQPAQVAQPHYDWMRSC